jgi:hypothetical protein
MVRNLRHTGWENVRSFSSNFPALTERMEYSTYCGISWKVVGSIPERAFWDSLWPLGSTQPLTEMNTRGISWEVKAAGAYGWQPYHFHELFITSGNLNLLEPYGPVQDCVRIVLLFGDQRVGQQEIIGQETNLVLWSPSRLPALPCCSI